MTENKPIIAVLQDWVSVLSAIDAAGAIPLEVDTLKELSQASKSIDGIVLTGGGDIAPERYGMKHISSMYGVNATRDKLEFAAVKMARRKRLPIMGICRGHQLINVAYGGTLLQHLGHMPYAKNHEGVDHLVLIRSRSILAKRLRPMQFTATSIHHQAIDRLGDGLVPVGWSSDGIIEAIESTPGTAPYVLGVQFHPELDRRLNDEGDAIFEHFVAMVQRRANGRQHDYQERLDRVFSLRWEPYTNRYGGNTHLMYDDLDYGHSESERETYGSAWAMDMDDDAYNEWLRINNSQEGKVLRFPAVLQTEPDNDYCEFPPCQAPDDCATWNDCAARAIANRNALLMEHGGDDGSGSTDIEKYKRGSRR